MDRAWISIRGRNSERGRCIAVCLIIVRNHNRNGRLVRIGSVDFQTLYSRVVNLKVASNVLGTGDVDRHFIGINALIINSRLDFVGLAV